MYLIRKISGLNEKLMLKPFYIFPFFLKVKNKGLENLSSKTLVPMMIL
jgi:hypothetical protein